MNEHRLFEQFIELLDKADSYATVYDSCVWLCGQYGFDHFHYGARIPTSLTKPSFIHISGYPLEWWQRYKDNNYIAYDPTVAHCAKSVLPYDWHETRTQRRDTTTGKPAQPDVMRDASEFGLVNGISIPLHDANGVFSMLSFTSSSHYSTSKKKFSRLLPTAHYISSLTHETVMRIARQKQEVALSQQYRLTKREKECLLWAAEGKTTWETSQILNISERTVVFHCQNASQKLHVNNRPQAIARAISLGIISPQFGD